MLTALGLAAVAVLIVANGYFVAAEFAFVSARRPQLEELARGGDHKARRALGVRGELSFVLSGAQLGITVTSLVVGFIAEPTLGRALEPVVASVLGDARSPVIALTLGLVVATAAQMVFGELAPKNLAIARAESLARILAGSVSAYTRLAGPVIRLFDGAANRLLRAIGVEPVADVAEGVTVEELDLLVEETARSGALAARPAALLERAIDFPRLTAADAMVPRPRVEVLNKEATGGELRARLAGTHTRFPVSDDDENLDAAVGVVHAKDLLTVPPAERDAVAVGSLARPLVAVPEALPLHAVIDKLRQAGTEMALVVDEYGGSAGIVTLEDVLEELVGPIADEHDSPEAGVVTVGKGWWSVPGWWRIDEIARDTGVELPDGDYDTVGGLVLRHLGRIPATGDAVDVDGAVVEVTAMSRRRVTRVRVGVPEAPEAR